MPQSSSTKWGDGDRDLSAEALAKAEAVEGAREQRHPATGRRSFGQLGKFGQVSIRIWLSGLVAIYDDRILGLDASSAAIAGQLEAKAISSGHDPGMADAAIAGIAKAHDLIVVTLDTKHFLTFGGAVSSPDDAAGST